MVATSAKYILNTIEDLFNLRLSAYKSHITTLELQFTLYDIDQLLGTSHTHDSSGSDSDYSEDQHDIDFKSLSSLAQITIFIIDERFSDAMMAEKADAILADLGFWTRSYAVQDLKKVDKIRCVIGEKDETLKVHKW